MFEEISNSKLNNYDRLNFNLYSCYKYIIMKKIILIVAILLLGYGIYNFLQPPKVLEKVQITH